MSGDIVASVSSMRMLLFFIAYNDNTPIGIWVLLGIGNIAL